jgi:hypothetical protein
MKRFLKPIQKYGLFKNMKGDVAYPGFTITVQTSSTGYFSKLVIGMSPKLSY